jgi:Mannosyltransferase (PIG-V)
MGRGGSEHRALRTGGVRGLVTEQAPAARAGWRSVSQLTVRDRLIAAARSPSLTWRAFLTSRLLVLLAGAGGVLTTTKHDGIAALLTLRQLGPVGNLLAGSANRFDAGYYLAIAGHGYAAVGARGTAFYPLYPFSIRVLGFVTGSDVLAGMLISAVSFSAALVVLHRLTELELGRAAADATVLLMAFAPLTLFFTAVYTESLFLLLSVGTLLALRRERWMLAGILAALAALTRPTGILLAVPIAVAVIRRRRRLHRQILWSLTPPAAVGLYLVTLSAAGYPWMAPFQAEASWHRLDVGPLVGFTAALVAAIKGAVAIVGNGASIYHPTLLGPLGHGAESVLLFLLLLLCLALLARCLRSLPLEYGAYAALAVAMCISSPQIGQPLTSFDRYTLTIVPLWMAAGAWVAKRGLQRPVVVVGSILLVFYTVQFSSWSFIA